MANAVFDKGRQNLLEGNIDWLVHDIQVVFCTAAYVRDLANDATLADIPAPARVGTSANLAGKTSTDGVASATDPVITATGTATQAVLYMATGVDATSLLIASYDTITGFPVTAGQVVTFQFAGGVCFAIAP